MSWRRIALSLLMLLSMGVSLVGVTTVAQASPQAPQVSQVSQALQVPQALQATYGAPKEGAKVILADTSIDGPAITSGYGGTFIAWTGTDAQHHINLMTSADGLHYSNKHILPETSLWRPAIAFIGSLRTVPFEGTLVLAWTGTDTHHTLNLELISTPSFKVTQKYIFWGETSFTAPAVGVIPGDVNSHVYLAWAGTDNAHTLNIIHRTTFDKTQDKKILWGWNSISRPNLSHDLSSDSKGEMLLSWTGVNNRLYFAYLAADRIHWTMASTSPLSTKSAWAPSMIGYFTTTQPTHWLAWTGTGTTSTRYLTVQYTQHYPNWSDANARTTFNETAISSPTLDFGHTANKGLIGWAGTDPYHHLNVAVVYAPAASASVTLGPKACPTAVSTPAYWQPIIKQYAAGASPTAERVTCASMLGNTSLQVLVTARRADQTVDAYVFNNITRPAPTLLLHTGGLVKGEAKISGYSTVLTGQVDKYSSVNVGKSASAMIVDLFREFAWSASAGKMTQIAFPGIFPDLTRYQAEDAQAAVNQGHQPWRLSATMVANTLSLSFLKWPLNQTTATLLSGGGTHDVSAVVRVARRIPGSIGIASGGSITVTFSRLEGNTNGGIWEAISVAAPGLSITSPAPESLLRSPVMVTGGGHSFEGDLGVVTLLDHLFTPLGHVRPTGARGTGQTTFSTTLSFTSSFPPGIQEGTLVFTTFSQADGLAEYAVIQKALISGATS